MLLHRKCLPERYSIRHHHIVDQSLEPWRHARDVVIGAMSGCVSELVLTRLLPGDHSIVVKRERIQSVLYGCIEVPVYLVAAISAVCYVVARFFIVIEAFIALRSLPPEAYEVPSWVQWLPHL